MSVIAKICRVIPIHTADVERTFPQLKMIKTGIRNRMCEQTLDALLRIVTEGPCLEDYPIGEAVNLWAKKKKTDSYQHDFFVNYYIHSVKFQLKKKNYLLNTEYSGLHIIIDVLGGYGNI